MPQLFARRAPENEISRKAAKTQRTTTNQENCQKDDRLDVNGQTGHDLIPVSSLRLCAFA
jgi:hypothetical protein